MNERLYRGFADGFRSGGITEGYERDRGTRPARKQQGCCMLPRHRILQQN